MRSILSLVACVCFGLCSAPLLHATMTVAWQVPIEVSLGEHDWQREATKLDHLPGASAFFQPGDELWDLSPLVDRPEGPLFSKDEEPTDFAESADPALPKIPALKWTGDWVVWNARSRTFIARGTRNEIMAVERRLHLRQAALQVSTTLELVDRHSGKSRAVTLPSGFDQKVSIEADGWQIEATATGYTTINAVTLQLATAWDEPGNDHEWKVDTSATFLDGERVLVARHAGWELWGIAELQEIDGTPLARAKMKERDDGSIVAVPDRSLPLNEIMENLDPGLRFSAIWLPAASIVFSQLGEVPPATTPLIEPPATLTRWVRGRFVDALPLILKKAAVPAEATFFAGYDPISDILVIAGTTSAVESLSGLAESNFCPPANFWVEANEASGNWSVLGTPNLISRISRTTDEKEDLVFEILPSGTSDRLELKLKLDAALPENAAARLDCSLFLPFGRALKAGEFTSSDGRQVPIELTAHWKEIYK